LPEVSRKGRECNLKPDDANAMMEGNMLWQTGLRKVKKLLTTEKIYGICPE
jgi:hypothetical protein